MRTVDASIGFTIDEANVHVCHNGELGGRHQAQIALCGGVYLWATADELFELADRLRTVAVDMRTAARVAEAASTVVVEESSPGQVAEVNPHIATWVTTIHIDVIEVSP